MASLPANATALEIEEELAFLDVLIESLDSGADEYEDRLAEHESTKRDLTRRLELLESGLAPQGQVENMAGPGNQNSAFWQTTMNGPPGGSTNGYDSANPRFSGQSSGSSEGRKRTRPYDLAFDDGLRQRSKRPTPDPSNAGTPTSSSESLDLNEHAGVDFAERAWRRQAQVEAALNRQRAQAQQDEQYARSLHQQHARPSTSVASSSKANLQTMFGFDGSYQKPPPRVKPAPTATPPRPQGFTPPYGSQTPSYRIKNEHSRVKPEPSSSRGEGSPQGSRSTEVVDLTAVDSDDDDLVEIAPSGYTPSRRAQQPPLFGLQGPTPQPQTYQQMPGAYPQQMPGAYPMTQGAPQYLQQYIPPHVPAQQPVYTHTDAADDRVRGQYSVMRNAQLAMQNAIAGVKYGASSVSGQLRELNGLINGSKLNPYTLDDDDNDLVYGGARQRPLGADPLDPYAGHQDLYQDRFDVLAAYDPAKSKEEINALLENIRPDEDMPAHLRVQTPAAMAIRLHKYQELGLTWLKKCEEGTNKGGILADDMGLGKTIQMLSLLVERPSTDPRCKTTLIVGPLALLRQWAQEIETKIKPGRHALKVFTYHSAKKKDFNELRLYDVVLTTYGTLAAELKKLEGFYLRRKNDPNAVPRPNEKCPLIGPSSNWYRVILDEAQNIKNKGTQAAKASYNLKAQYRFCMTGTPMMNNVDELFSLIHFLQIKPYCSWSKFRVDFSAPLRGRSDEMKDRSMRMLQALCKAIMLRRTKQSKFEGQPILVLPERTTDIDHAEFEEDQRAFYKAIEEQTTLQFNKYLKAGTVGKNYSQVLVMLLRLRQAACHPHLIKDFSVAAAADITTDDMLDLAKLLEPQVVERIRERNGAFECPVCYDATENPAIFIPCGHDTCSECFAKITDPANAARAGEGDGATAKCPNCRGEVKTKRVTDFDSFKKVWQPELLTEEERAALDLEAVDSETESEADDSATESGDDGDSETEVEDDDVDAKGNLKGFIVNDDAETDSATESEGEADADDKTGLAGPSGADGKKPTVRKEKKKKLKKAKAPEKSKKAKGKQKKVPKKKKPTLADLRTGNKAQRKRYIKKLKDTFVSSAKIDKLISILRPIMEDKVDAEKVLIFSQWTTFLDLVEIGLDREGWSCLRYDGSMRPRDRDDAVDEFRDPRKNARIMLVSLKAGNAGLNLNMASQVVILDPFWNPYIEEQAIDRAHRLGQSRRVQVHRVLVEETVEDRIVALQDKKRELISTALDEKAGQNIARLGVQELAYLFGVTANPAQAVQYVPQNRR